MTCISNLIQRGLFPILLMICAGCAGLRGSKPLVKPSSAAATPPPQTSVSSYWDQEVAKVLSEVSALENIGELAAAIEYCKIALTIDPVNLTARSELERLTVKRNNLAEKRYLAGNSLRETNPKDAARNYLAALWLRGDYTEARLALGELQLQSAEASIKARLKREAGKLFDDDIDVANYSLEIATLSFEDGDYNTAIHEFEKIKVRFPHDEDIRVYLDSSYYNVGIGWYGKQNYQKALSSFVKVRKGFEQVDEFSHQCREQLKPAIQEIYQAGLGLFKGQNFNEAQERFEMVVEIDPTHKMAKDYLKKIAVAKKSKRK